MPSRLFWWTFKFESSLVLTITLLKAPLIPVKFEAVSKSLIKPPFYFMNSPNELNLETESPAIDFLDSNKY